MKLSDVDGSSLGDPAVDFPKVELSDALDSGSGEMEKASPQGIELPEPVVDVDVSSLSDVVSVDDASFHEPVVDATQIAALSEPELADGLETAIVDDLDDGLPG